MSRRIQAPDGWMTVAEAARRLGISPAAARHNAKAHQSTLGVRPYSPFGDPGRVDVWIIPIAALSTPERQAAVRVALSPRRRDPDGVEDGIPLSAVCAGLSPVQARRLAHRHGIEIVKVASRATTGPRVVDGVRFYDANRLVALRGDVS